MRSEKYNKEPSKPMKHKKLNLFTRIWSLLYIAVTVALCAGALYTNILPAKILYAGAGALFLVSLLIFPALFSKRFKKSRKIIALIFSAILMLGYGLGIAYMAGTADFFNKVTAAKTQTEDYYVLVKKDGKYKDIDEIKDKTVFTYLTNEENYSTAKAILQKKEKTEYEMIENLSQLGEGLLDDTYEIVFVSAAHYRSICEGHDGFEDESEILYTVQVELKSKDISKDVDVTKEAFNVYISGIDVEGTIDVASRSDVNMIATVNPKTRTVLLTSIPRDYLVQLPTKDNASDKLTHTGIYGIEETVGSVEKLLNLDMNYYVKVNYTTVTQFVDSIGGITVDSDYTFTTSGMHMVGLDGLTFYEGENYLTGSQALAFARERHAFSDGDVQRNKNQQKVMKAIIEKATTSTTLLTKYSTILNSLEGYVEINMSSDDIKNLVKMQLDDMKGWTIVTQNMEGDGNNRLCYSTGDFLVYVMEPNEKSVVKITDNIRAVMDGMDGKSLNTDPVEEDADGTDDENSTDTQGTE